jgi:hypothetical protein
MQFRSIVFSTLSLLAIANAVAIPSVSDVLNVAKTCPAGTAKAGEKRGMHGDSTKPPPFLISSISYSVVNFANVANLKTADSIANAAVIPARPSAATAAENGSSCEQLGSLKQGRNSEFDVYHVSQNAP